MTKETRYLALQELIEKERAVRKQIEDVDLMIKAVDAGRDRLESGLDGLYLSSEEMKGQIRILKERQAWLIGELDKLRRQIATYSLPGDSV